MRSLVQILGWILVFALSVGAAAAAEYAVVAKRTIYPGQMIEAVDLTSIKLIRQPLINYRFVTRQEEIVGMQARRTILKGRFIRAGSAEPAPLVKAGSHKRVEFRNGGLAISLVGVALSDAGAGDLIRMRNPTSGKIFSAQVLEDGTIVTGAL